MKNSWDWNGCDAARRLYYAASTSPRNTRPTMRRSGKSTSRSSTPYRATGSRCTLASSRRDDIETSDAPYILMHGFPDSLHLYDRLAPLLAKKRRVITFDFLGWGNSDKPEDHRYDVRQPAA